MNAQDGAAQEPATLPAGDERLPPTPSDHFIAETTALVLLLCLYSVLCIFLPAALGVRTNLLAIPEGSKPEWYFLFLYQYVRLAPPIVGAVTPALLLVLLGAWPFLDRNPSRSPRRRVLALLLVVLVVLSLLLLTYFGWVG